MLTLERNIGGGEGWGLDGDGACALDDYQALAKEGFALRRGEALHGGLTTVVGTQYLTITLTDKDHLIFGPRTEVAVLIDHLGHNEGGVLSLVIRSETDMMGSACGTDGLLAYRLTILT